VLTARIWERWDDVATLEPGWNPLLAQSASDTVFLTWEWMTSWWHAYSNARRPMVISFERSGEVVGLAPLCRQRISRYGVIRHDAVAFIGDGTADSDYLDLIVRTGEEGAVAECLAGTLASLGFGAVAFLNDVPGSSPNLAPLARALRTRNWSWRAEPVACAEALLPESWDLFLGALQPRMRTKIRSLTRRLEERHQVRFRYASCERDIALNLPSLFHLHQRRWEREGRLGVFASEDKRRFYEELSRRFLERGWLRLSTLEVDGAAVAHQMCFEYRNTMFLLQEAFDPDWEEQGVGNVLRTRVLQDCIDRGVGNYDFLGGMTDHKRSWGATTKESLRITAAPPTTPLWLLVDVPRFLDRGGLWVRARQPWRSRSGRAPRPKPAADSARLSAGLVDVG
jgi:CelD/BcsL family acetyltransferase involved in cellulose biosynthesis